MEFKNNKIIRNFISEEEKKLIINWVDNLNHKGHDSNYHLSEIGKKLNGKSYIFDISNTNHTNYITKYQSFSDVSHDKLPIFIDNIIERISKDLLIPIDNIFYKQLI